MIFIDADEVELPDGWLTRAYAAEAALAQAQGSGARRVILAKHASLWSELGPVLRKLSRGKCWYCELHQVRSDMPVDHYRPKATPSEAPQHPGYWWLAFRPNNFRYSCTYCNSRRVDREGGTAGGKQSHFPLVDEGTRAADQWSNLQAEEPILLDPTVKADPGLLYFGLEGRAEPHPRLCPEGSSGYKRAALSIELLHLNHGGIRDERKKLNRTLDRAFQRALDNWAGYAAGDQACRGAFRAAFDDLGRAISEQAVLSASARAYLRGKRGDGSAAELILEQLGL